MLKKIKILLDNDIFFIEKKIFNPLISFIFRIKFGGELWNEKRRHGYVVVSFAKLFRSLIFVRRFIKKKSKSKKWTFFELFDFHSFIGVEVHQPLVAQAKKKYPNLEGLICDDALNIDYCDLDRTVFFFYNPMPSEFLRPIITKITNEVRECIFIFIGINEISNFREKEGFSLIYSEKSPSNVYVYSYCIKGEG